MKRIMCLVLVLLMVLPFAVACADNTGDGEIIETIQNEDLYLGLGRGATEPLIRYASPRDTLFSPLLVTTLPAWVLNAESGHPSQDR